MLKTINFNNIFWHFHVRYYVNSYFYQLNCYNGKLSSEKRSLTCDKSQLKSTFQAGVSRTSGSRARLWLVAYSARSRDNLSAAEAKESCLEGGKEWIWSWEKIWKRQYTVTFLMPPYIWPSPTVYDVTVGHYVDDGLMQFLSRPNAHCMMKRMLGFGGPHRPIESHSSCSRHFRSIWSPQFKLYVASLQ